MTPKIEFFFDLSSPWTAIAYRNIHAIREDTGAIITWRPILVGGVFNAVNPAVYAAREQTENRKLQHSWKILKDWAALSDVQMNFPSPHHPLKSVLAMRLCCALEDNQTELERFMEIAFAAYFGDQVNLDNPEALTQVAIDADLDGANLLARTQDQAVKDRLRANTDELIERGGYGSPTIFVNGYDMYFGNDQLALVRYAIEGK